MAAVATWIPNRVRRRAASVFSWRCGGNVFGDRLQWRIAGGAATAAILRIWRVEPPARAANASGKN